MTLKEEKELAIIESGLQFNAERGRWMAAYPWIKPSSELPDNRAVAMATLRSTEKRLSRDKSHADTYSYQIADMITRGAAREVSEEELAKYTGPKFYISHFEVLNPKSKSTPCRIVYNSSAKFRGHALNEYLAKGPSMLNLLLGVLLRFRENRHGFIGDISNMFHAIDIPIHDQMTHLFLWRNCAVESHPKTYAMTAVNMGDRPSATIAQVALRKSAEAKAAVFPDASKIIIENAYMDDIPASTKTQEVSEKLRREIDLILEDRGFKIKEWICSGSAKEVPIEIKVVSEEIEGVLGLEWMPKDDWLRIRVNPDKPEVASVTKRSILSRISKIYDPVGLLTAFTVKAKILLRKIWAINPKVGWDDLLDVSIQNDWRLLLDEMKEVEQVRFSRTITPEDAVGNPSLIIFSNGSEDAYGAVAYARWKTTEGFVSKLIAAKSRMAPLKTIDIVRIELCGAVIGKRLRETLQSEMELKFERVIHIIDSEIVQAMIWKESYGFNTFVANRIGELHQTTKPNEWHWVAGKPWLNVADLTTRGCSPKEMHAGSIWQEGPEFLKQEEGFWPTESQPRQGLILPETKGKLVATASAAPKARASLCDHFNLERFSNWRL